MSEIIWFLKAGKPVFLGSVLFFDFHAHSYERLCPYSGALGLGFFPFPIA